MENLKTEKKHKDEEQEQQFPGYPPYPDNEDITINNERVSLDSDGLPIEEASVTAQEDINADIINTSESNVTKEDLEALGPKDLSLDMDEDEQLKHRTQPVDFAAEDLDIPGSELDDESEALGTEDEENNSYSLGGDNHEDLEETKE